MARVKINFPPHPRLFECSLPIRITDLNYGNHLGNDKLLSLVHEARVLLLHSWSFTEMDAGGSSLIMADAMISYKGEGYYGDVLTFNIWADEITSRSFDLLFAISTIRNGDTLPIAEVKIGMVCYDYQQRCISVVSNSLSQRLHGSATT